ncbi:ABC transporter ATP-binding protein [Paenibacillus flagellatus]|uniref:ABC transporter ATP-binding protein n=1 Tax=Paenibacillus flagellatus TaxID=2211139 RepID=A0A2V5JXT4_9BACL|nr:ABC transporter ATP-binding protein [Paenibacillus flagellatus]PYI51628.1 ABC transporter ATP-binding protein [Paenibacillus flagellatus]
MTLVRVERLVKRFGSGTAVDGASFSIEEGRCVALLGPNGAGKTTTLKMLAGLLEPTEGDIVFRTEEPGNEGRPVRDIRRLIGFLPQYPAFFPWMSGREYLTFSGRLARLPKTEAKRRAEELLATVGLAEAAGRRIGGYSGGMKQRLGIAQALVHRPKLLLLDEPVSALDPIGRREVLDMIGRIRRETTVLFSTHVLHDAEDMCDDIIMMSKGKVAAAGTLEEIGRRFSEPVIRIRAETPLNESVERWRTFASVRSIEAEPGGRDVRLTVADLAEARAALWRDLGERGVPVVRFEAGRTTLEELFLKAVSG